MLEDDIEVEQDSLPEDLNDTHESLIFQGSIDALDGTESYAVKYLAGALMASGHLTHSQINGVESVWTTVKSGFSKSITYIKNFFNGIWGFFFGKDADAKDEAVAAEVEKDKAVLTKLPAESELDQASSTAIVAASTKVALSAENLEDKIKRGLNEANIMTEDESLKTRLVAAYAKLKAITDRLAAAGGKQARGIALAVALRASVWNLYFREFRGVLTSDVKALAAKTQAEIARLDTMVRSADEAATQKIKEKLVSLREVMKVYTSIQQLKTTVRSYTVGVLDKLKPSHFKAKKA